VVGRGWGVIYDPNRKKNEFACGLGYASNNEAEALAIFQGLSILKERGLFNCHQIVVPSNPFEQLQAMSPHSRVIALSHHFESTSFYQVLRVQNEEDDFYATLDQQWMKF
jgi:hypothetical protein